MVHIGLGHGYIVLESTGHRLEKFMHEPQHRVAVLHRIHYEPYGKKVIYLIEGSVLGGHLSINAVKMLCSAFDFGFDTHFQGFAPHNLDDVLYIFLAFSAFFCDLFHKIIIALFVYIAKAQIFKLPFDLMDTKPVCKGGIDFQGFPCFLLLLLLGHEFQCSHIVQPVSQLDDDHADILGHSQEHLSEILCLNLLLCGIGNFGQLGHAVHKFSYLLPKFGPHLLNAHSGILNRIMKYTCSNGSCIHLKFSKNDANLQRMDDIWVTGNPFLTLVSIPGKLISLADQFQTGFRTIFSYEFL